MKRIKRPGYIKQDNSWFDTACYESIYSENFVYGIAKEIGIHDRPTAKAFRKRLLTSASFYENNKLNRENRTIKSDETKALKELYARFSGLKDQLDNLWALGFSGDRLVQGISAFLRSERGSEILKNPLKNKAVESVVDVYEIKFNAYALSAIIETTEEGLKEAISIKLANEGGPKGIELEAWVSEIGQFWEQYSSVKYTAGKYYKEAKGHPHHTLSVLERLIVPLDSRVINQNLATALRKYSKGNKRVA